MTEEELECIANEYNSTDWYEDNWYRSKNRGDKERQRETNRRAHKLSVDQWDLPWEGETGIHYKHDRYCWKTKRKTQYLIKKEKKNKKRKPAHREHWRYKNPVHSWRYLSQELNKIYDISRKQRLEHRRIEEEHFDELKKVGHYRYPDGGFIDNNNYYFDWNSQSWKVNKVIRWD